MHSQYLHAAAQQGLRQPGPYDGERALKTIHVGGIGGLGETITENDVADFFGQQGEVTAVRISGRFCWVEFSDARAAQAALELDGTTTGGHHLRVSQSKSAIHSNGLKRRDGADAAAAYPGVPAGYGVPGVPYGAPPYGVPHGGAPPYAAPPYGAAPPYAYPPYGYPPYMGAPGGYPPPPQGAGYPGAYPPPPPPPGGPSA